MFIFKHISGKNELHVTVQIIGTPRQCLCWHQGEIVKENIYEGYSLVNESTHRVYGEVRYYHTGICYTPDNYNKSFDVVFQATNAMSPWNTLTAGARLTVPDGI